MPKSHCSSVTSSRAARQRLHGGEGVVDQDVQATPTLDGVLNHLPNIVVPGHVGAKCGSRSARRLDATDVRRRQLFVDIRNEHPRAIRGQTARNGAAKAGGAAGHMIATRDSVHGHAPNLRQPAACGGARAAPFTRPSPDPRLSTRVRKAPV